MSGGTAAAARPGAASVCRHCGARLAGAEGDEFCCSGCAAAHAVIAGAGLSGFYARRIIDPASRRLRPDPAEVADVAATSAAFHDGESTLHLMVDGLQCAACVWLVETLLAREPDVVQARANLSTRRLTLRWRGPPAAGQRLVDLLARLGFRLAPFDPAALETQRRREERELLRAMAVAGFAAGNVMLLSVSVWAGHVEGMGQATRDLMHWLSALIALPAVAYAGIPFFRSAANALAAGRTNMDVPISLGVAIAAGMSLFETVRSGEHAYFDSSITLLFFLLVGRFLDSRARGKAREAGEQLLGLARRVVTVVAPDGTLRAKAPDAVASGEVLFVAAGERLGVDGRIRDGVSDLDASLVTGEATPQRGEPGTPVFAGTLNLSAPIRVEATATGERTLLAEIVRLMEAAERGRARHVALADRVARRYAPVVHVAAAATFALWMALGEAPWETALLYAVSVLIITCPCALALAVPVVQVVASGRLFRRGILLKAATALERLAAVDTVVFDKTGTLTVGRPELAAEPCLPPAEFRLAARVAAASRHPLAQALVRASGGEAVPLPGVREHPGLGLSAPVPGGELRLGSRTFCGVARDAGGESSELWFAAPGRAPVRFVFSDRLRPDAAATVAALKRAGYRVELLSGDRVPAVAAAAAQAGIDVWTGAADPAAKTRHLEGLRALGRRVLMVGDGLNDAPALAAASVSLSPAAAADVAQVAADAVFQGEALAPVAELLSLARRSERLVRQNLALALCYNLGAVPLAVFGYVTPLVAAVAMSSSSLLVIANTLRLGRARA